MERFRIWLFDVLTLGLHARMEEQEKMSKRRVNGLERALLHDRRAYRELAGGDDG